MPEPEHYNAVVIGGGPSGIFAACSLAATHRTLLLEAGRPMLQSLCPKIKFTLSGRLIKDTKRQALQCRRCNCLTGLGGAAFHFDTNLGYPGKLTLSKIEQRRDGPIAHSSTLERALNGFERADAGVRKVFNILHQHGLPRADPPPKSDVPSPFEHHFVGTDLSASQSITTETSLTVVSNMMDAFTRDGGEIRFGTRAAAIERGVQSRFVVEAMAEDGTSSRIGANCVIVAVGKLGLSWVLSTIEQLGLQVHPSVTVDIGVRLEAERARIARLSEQCSNPKLSYINQRGESVRTFCVCAGGRIMQYEFEQAVILDGQHCLTSPTPYTNFGIVTSFRVPTGVDRTSFAIDLARRVTRHGNGRPVACTVSELRRSRAGQSLHPTRALLTSLIDFEHSDLTKCLPLSVVNDVLGMADRLDATHPGMIGDDAVVAAPVIERLYPELMLSENMESSEPGLFFVGDASSKIIGVTYGAATGLAAAAAIAKMPMVAQ